MSEHMIYDMTRPSSAEVERNRRAHEEFCRRNLNIRRAEGGWVLGNSFGSSESVAVTVEDLIAKVTAWAESSK